MLSVLQLLLVLNLASYLILVRLIFQYWPWTDLFVFLGIVIALVLFLRVHLNRLRYIFYFCNKQLSHFFFQILLWLMPLSALQFSQQLCVLFLFPGFLFCYLELEVRLNIQFSLNLLKVLLPIHFWEFNQSLWGEFRVYFEPSVN